LPFNSPNGLPIRDFGAHLLTPFKLVSVASGVAGVLGSRFTVALPWVAAIYMLLSGFTGLG
jgi:hypothetical protein